MAQPRNIMKNLRIKDWLSSKTLTVSDGITGTVAGGATSSGALSGAVVCPLTEVYTGYTTSATGDITIALADGVAGQMKIIKCETKVTSDVIITPTNLAGYATITLDTTGDVALLVFDGTNWQIVSATATLA